ncbi:MAG: translocation/assembly module TamB domain-containing protein [Cognatishimia sp.]
MRQVFLILATLIWAPFAAAQNQPEAQEGQSRIVTFIEEALSDGARDVRIQGFKGALSSTAELDLLTISDAGGVWFKLEQAQLVWQRSALLRGALNIEKISAKRIEIIRAPVQSAAAPTPEATPFALPNLPVSIALGALDVAEIKLGKALFGLAATVSAKGNASLADGAGAAKLTIARLDGPSGTFDVAAAFDNVARVLDLNLLVSEDAGGVLATLMDLPGQPALEFSALGKGPVDDLAIDLKLATDGVARLSGRIETQKTATEENVYSADVSGDLSALFLPEYQNFFGDEVALTAHATRRADGALDVSALRLTTAALNLNGALALAPNGQPQRFALDGVLGQRDLSKTRLPLSGQVMDVSSAELSLQYDAARGDALSGVVRFDGLQTSDLQIANGQLLLNGRLDPVDASELSAKISAKLSGVQPQDAKLAKAIGPNLELSFLADWQKGAPLQLDALSIKGATLSVTGAADILAADQKVALKTSLTGRVQDLAAFAPLSGLALDGSMQMDLTAEAELLSGAFRADLTAIGQDLAIGQPMADKMLRGTSQVAVSMARDQAGLALDSLKLENPSLTAAADGAVSSDAGGLQVRANLNDASQISTALTGALALEAELNRGPGDKGWNVRALTQGIAGLQAQVTGQVGLPNGDVALEISGTAPLALSDSFVAPRSLRGAAQFDLSVDGPPALGSVNGQLQISDARLFDPQLGTSLENLSLQARLAGPRMTLRAGGNARAGGSLTVDGWVDLAAQGLPAQIDIALRDIRYVSAAFETEIAESNLRLSGQLASQSSLTGALRLKQTDIMLDDLSSGGAEPIPDDIQFVGQNAAQYATRKRAGLIKQSAGAGTARVALDVSVQAPSRIFVRGKGLDVELGGAIQLGGTTDDVVPSGAFDLIRGRFSLQGQRFDVDEATVRLQGSFDPHIRIVSSTSAAKTRITLTLEGPASAPDLTLTSVPNLPEDEILARLLFGRSASKLSPVQALQLVDTISSLAGGKTLTSGLRKSLGVDDFDLSTDETGQTQLRLGRYISDNAYSNVEIDGGGDVEIQLNFDVTPNLTLRGRVNNQGESGVGVFLERDY